MLTQRCVSVVLACLSVAAALPTNVHAQARSSGSTQAQERQPGEGGRREGRGGGGGGGMFGGGGPFGGGMFGGGGSPFDLPISAQDMKRYTAAVTLTSDQKQAVDALYDAFSKSFEEQAEVSRAAVDSIREQARETRDFSRMREMGDEIVKFRTKAAALEKSFFDDVRSLLNPEQIASWEAAERTNRREKSVSRGLISGERLDLAKLVSDLKLSEAEYKPIKAMLEQYSVDLDRELLPRNAFQEEAMTKFRDVMTSFDMDAMQKLIDQGRSLAMKVRDVNARYARQIEGELPEAKKGEFADAVRKQSFPMIYRPTTSARWLEAAMKLPDLTSDQKASLEAIQASFDREVGGLNSKYETLYAKREETWNPVEALKNAGPDAGFRAMGQAMQSFETDEMRTLRDQRRTLDDATSTKIKNVLTPEQQAKMPQPEGQRRRDGGEERPRRSAD